jgi:hypothetical protein
MLGVYSKSYREHVHDKEKIHVPVCVPLFRRHPIFTLAHQKYHICNGHENGNE